MALRFPCKNPKRYRALINYVSEQLTPELLDVLTTQAAWFYVNSRFGYAEIWTKQLKKGAELRIHCEGASFAKYRGRGSRSWTFCHGPFYGKGKTAAQAFAACLKKKAKFRLTDDGMLLHGNRPIVEHPDLAFWTRLARLRESGEPTAATVIWKLPLEPEIMFAEKWLHLRLELRRWFDSNPAILNLTSDFSDGAFTTRCLSIIKETGSKLYYVKDGKFTITFAHETYGEVNLFVQGGVAADVIFPISVSAKMSDKTRKLHDRSSAGLNNWSCALELGAGFNGCYYHHCAAAGATPAPRTPMLTFPPRRA